MDINVCIIKQSTILFTILDEVEFFKMLLRKCSFNPSNVISSSCSSLCKNFDFLGDAKGDVCACVLWKYTPGTGKDENKGYGYELS